MSVSIHSVDSLRTLLELEQVKPDAFLGAGPNLGWGRIYGGQVVSQALRAAGLTVSASHRVHS
ncbi:MAG: acyl-CoA thioesterase II, partial [Actinobacteria bacterium]|nr:acyl-CoA thioesterase II [Actinomycetota bacterium]